MQMPEDRSVVIIPTIVILSFFFLAFLSLNPALLSPNSQAGATFSESRVDPTPIITADVSGAQVIAQTVHYNNPAGGDNVRFMITVTGDGVIKDAVAEVKANPEHQISVDMQTNFANALKGEVVGKELSSLELDRIGGASLTTGAFKKFLSDIQS